MTHRGNRKEPIRILIVLALVAGLSITPGATFAEQHGHSMPGEPGVIPGRPVPPRPIAPRPVLQRPPFPHPHHRHFVSVWPSWVVYTAPLVSYQPPAYYDPPAVYDPAPVYDPALPMPPSTPGTIEYPTGRYELRGDGVTTPYTWVWIPNPPPPPQAPQMDPPAPSASPTPPDPSPTLHVRLYHWTDAQGVIHLTDVSDAVPASHQARGK